MQSPTQKALVKNQHYVPQCYLRHFTVPGRDQLSIIDKSALNIFLTLPRNVAAQRFFYDFEGDEILSQLGQQPLETLYSLIEGEMSRNWDILLDNLDQRGGFDPADKARMSLYIHTQLHRTPQHRRMMNGALHDLIRTELEAIQAAGTLEVPAHLQHLTLDQMAQRLDHAPLNFVLHDAQTRQDHQQQLEAMTWQVLKTEVTLPFITSDAPVQYIPGRLDGQECRFLTVTYPLSPRYLLLLTPHPGTPVADCRVESARADHVVSMNQIQLMAAERQAYASSPDWTTLIGGHDPIEFIRMIPSPGSGSALQQ